jgi:hypothetical protein
MNEHGFIMFNRTDEAIELLRDPNAFALLALIARRARWRSLLSPDGLEFGEAMLGDCENFGMTRAVYRNRLKKLVKCKQITIRKTNKGTIAKLTSSLVFDLNLPAHAPPENHQQDQQRTNAKPLENHQKTNGKPLTNKDNKERKREREKGTAPMFISEAKARIAAIDQEINSIKSSFENFVKDDGVLKVSSKLKPEPMARIAELTQCKHEAERILKGA